MGPNPVPPTGRKDLQDLSGLSRAPAIAYLQKQSLPPAPRPKKGGSAKPVFPGLGRFLPQDFARWILQYLRFRIGFKHPFLTYEGQSDSGIYPLEGDDTVRIALAGDWGTGTDEAHRVAELISRFDPHYSIHLGDVYFVGDPKEIRENFLGEKVSAYEPCCWPPGSKGTFALNGNHEMYARGYGYFDLILPRMGLQRDDKAIGQRASFFCLKNDDWWILGLDTGYRSIGIPVVENFWTPDCALPDEIIVWLRGFFRPEQDKRGIILLSHHQYYSRYDDWYTRQAEQLAEFISRPVLWFWGHEHRLAIYEKYQTGKGVAAFGRCIGHGGMPVDLPGPIKHSQCRVERVDDRRYQNDENLDVGVNGFARLTFAGRDVKVEFVDIEDKVFFGESWTMDQEGGVTRVTAWPPSQSAG